VLCAFRCRSTTHVCLVQKHVIALRHRVIPRGHIQKDREVYQRKNERSGWKPDGEYPKGNFQVRQEFSFLFRAFRCSPSWPHTHTHTRTHTHTHRHTDTTPPFPPTTHTRTHRLTHTHTPATHTRTHTHTHMPSHTHRDIHTHNPHRRILVSIACCDQTTKGGFASRTRTTSKLCVRVMGEWVGLISHVGGSQVVRFTQIKSPAFT